MALLHQQEGGHGRPRPVCCSDGEGEFGEGYGDPVVGVQGQRPEIAGMAESAVADDAHGHQAFKSGGAGDRCGTSEGFERFGVGEAGPVIDDLAEDASS